MKPDWELLYNDETQVFPKLLQFGDLADPRFRYGINDKLQHSLYFRFPAKPKSNPIESIVMANVSLHEEIIDGHAALILTLLNNQLNNLFDDLIGSLVIQTRQLGYEAAKSDFIVLCNEWFELFDPLAAKLSKADLQGIFAEVYFLKETLKLTTASFNDILLSWTGPFGKGHDFEMGDNLFEIKSRLETSSLVHISSEYQLDYLSGQTLSLVVYEFFVSLKDGITIGQLITETAELLRTQIGVNITLFWAALAKTRLTNNNLNDYSQYLFSIKNVAIYNCCNINFPSIRRSTMPDAIRSIKYDLSLNELSQFEHEIIPLLI